MCKTSKARKGTVEFYKQENEILRQSIEDLTKQKTSGEQSRKWADDRVEKAEGELEGIHAVLDTLPDVIQRKKADGWGEHSASVRLASLFAARAFR